MAEDSAAAFVVDAIHLNRREAVLDDGTVLPITTLLDGDGEEVAHVMDARLAVTGRGGLWLCIDLAAFEWKAPA